MLLVEGDFISFGQKPRSHTWFFLCFVLMHSNLLLKTWDRSLRSSVVLFNSNKVLIA